MKPTANVFLDTRRALKNGKFPLKLSVTAARKNRSWTLDFSFTEEEYDKLVRNQRKASHKDEWNKIDAHIKKAELVIGEMMPFFSFNEFNDRYFHQSSVAVVSDKSSLLYLQNEVCQDYLRKGQFPMTIKIKDSVRSVLKFANRENISMRMITPAFCLRYENYMLAKSKKKSRNGAGINLRHVRILFNYGIKKKLIPDNWYPFSEYVIPFERKVKQPLNVQEFAALEQTTKIQSPAQRRALDAFLMAFYFNGSYASDFLRFRYENIQGDYLIFYRQKIRNSRKHDMKPIKIFLSEPLKELIKRVGNNPMDSSNYIFDVLKDGMTIEEEIKAIDRFNRRCWNGLKRIKKQLGISKDMNLKNARHTLANVLKAKNVNREFIKDIFGHNSIITTEHYLEGMDDNMHKNIMASITRISVSDAA